VGERDAAVRTRDHATARARLAERKTQEVLHTLHSQFLYLVPCILYLVSYILNPNSP